MVDFDHVSQRIDLQKANPDVTSSSRDEQALMAVKLAYYGKFLGHFRAAISMGLCIQQLMDG